MKSKLSTKLVTFPNFGGNLCKAPPCGSNAKLHCRSQLPIKRCKAASVNLISMKARLAYLSCQWLDVPELKPKSAPTKFNKTHLCQDSCHKAHCCQTFPGTSWPNARVLAARVSSRFPWNSYPCAPASTSTASATWPACQHPAHPHRIKLIGPDCPWHLVACFQFCLCANHFKPQGFQPGRRKRSTKPPTQITHNQTSSAEERKRAHISYYNITYACTHVKYVSKQINIHIYINKFNK